MLNVRWILATAVLAVWAIAVIADIFSTAYTVDVQLHLGCGSILGVLLGTGMLSADKPKSRAPTKDGE